MNFDYSLLFNAIGKLVGLALTVLVAVLTPKVQAWVEERIGREKAEKLLETIKMFVEAAEQLLRDSDPTGQLRKQFVRDHLEVMGIAYTVEIDALIEGLVYELNRDKREEIVIDPPQNDAGGIEAESDGAVPN